MKILKSVVGYLLPRLLFVALGVVLILLARGWQYSFEQGSIVRTGILDVHTTPSGATLYLDGNERGQTPEKISGLAPNRYRVTLEKDGYHPWQETVSIRPELVTTLYDIQLFAQPFLPTVGFETPGQLVSTSPDGSLLLYEDLPAETNLRTYLVLNPSGVRVSQFALPVSLTDNQAVQITWPRGADRLLLSVVNRSTGGFAQSYLIDMGGEEAVLHSVLDAPLPEAELTLDRQFIPQFIPQSKELLALTSAGELWRWQPEQDSWKTSALAPETAAKPIGVFERGFLNTAHLYYLAPAETPGALTLYDLNLGNGDKAKLFTDFTLAADAQWRVSDGGLNLLLWDTQQTVAVASLESDPQVDRYPQGLVAAYGWSEDQNLFLLTSSDGRLGFYNADRARFLFPYDAQGSGTNLVDACWNGEGSYVYTLQAQDNQVNLNVMEQGGGNRIELFQAAADNPTTDNAWLNCSADNRLLMGYPTTGKQVTQQFELP